MSCWLSLLRRIISAEWYAAAALMQELQPWRTPLASTRSIVWRPTLLRSSSIFPSTSCSIASSSEPLSGESRSIAVVAFGGRMCCGFGVFHQQRLPAVSSHEPLWVADAIDGDNPVIGMQSAATIRNRFANGENIWPGPIQISSWTPGRSEHASWCPPCLAMVYCEPSLGPAIRTKGSEGQRGLVNRSQAVFPTFRMCLPAGWASASHTARPTRPKLDQQAVMGEVSSARDSQSGLSCGENVSGRLFLVGIRERCGPNMRSLSATLPRSPAAARRGGRQLAGRTHTPAGYRLRLVIADRWRGDSSR